MIDNLVYLAYNISRKLRDGPEASTLRGYMFIIKVTKPFDITGTTILFGPFASKHEAEKALEKGGWKRLVFEWWKKGEFHAIIDKPIPVLVEGTEMLSQSL